ncbi:MAG: Formylmethanofuran dehydrogenase subunit E [Candidatus Alkanophagales archaeon MCA70_species_2]|nr:Formylmethanofuran dehydrogenase subunit E [Candidatus Alkanophaga liquidiphilum]
MDSRLVKRAVEFHGHLGPFLVLGLKMGLFALERLGAAKYELSVVVETDSKPPASCIIDGIQVSTGCTVGRGNLKVKWCEGTPKIVFKKDSKLLGIKVKKEALREIRAKMKREGGEAVAKDVLFKDEKQLFDFDIFAE